MSAVIPLIHAEWSETRNERGVGDVGRGTETSDRMVVGQLLLDRLWYLLLIALGQDRPGARQLTRTP